MAVAAYNMRVMAWYYTYAARMLYNERNVVRVVGVKVVDK